MSIISQPIAFLLRDEDRMTPLFHAAREGCPLTTNLLIERGAKINTMDKNRVSLCYQRLHVSQTIYNFDRALTGFNRQAMTSLPRS